MKKLVLIAVLVSCTLAAQAQGWFRQPMIVVMPNGTIATKDMMGGMETIETAFRNPELFRYVWVLSSSFSPGHQQEYVDEIKLKEIAPALNSNFQDLVFTQGKKAKDPVLIQVLLNGFQATLPLPEAAPGFYRWEDFKAKFNHLEI